MKRAKIKLFVVRTRRFRTAIIHRLLTLTNRIAAQPTAGIHLRRVRRFIRRRFKNHHRIRGAVRDTFQTNTLVRDQVFELWKQHGLPEPSTRTIYDAAIASIAAEGHYTAPQDGLPIAQDTDQADGVRTYMVKQLLQITSGCPLYTGEELYAAEEAVSPAVYQQLMTVEELIEAITATLTGNGVEIYSDLPDDQRIYGRPLVVPTDQVAASFQQVRNTCAHIRSQW
jgi:hypothetical protein